jgi:hypothetical protein
MSRARTLAGAIGSDGALNVADVAGLAAVASSGSASDLSTGNLAVARLPSSGVELGSRNRIINGAMDFWQRGTSFGAGGSGPFYTADRWNATRYAAGGVTISQQAHGDASLVSKFCIRAQRNSGNTDTTAYFINQPIEVANSRDLKGKFVTLSFMARKGANFTGTFTASIATHATSGTEDGMYYNNFRTVATANTNSTPTLTTSFQRFTLSASLPSNAAQVGVAFFCDTPTGTAGANDYFEITEVQLEPGVVTPFEYRHYSVEEGLCRRYYWRSVTGDYKIISALMYNNPGAKGPINFPVRMRAAPSVSGSGNFYLQSGDTSITNGSFTSVWATSLNTDTVWCDFGGTLSGVSKGALTFLGTMSGAYIEANAEL